MHQVQRLVRPTCCPVSDQQSLQGNPTIACLPAAALRLSLFRCSKFTSIEIEMRTSGTRPARVEESLLASVQVRTRGQGAKKVTNCTIRSFIFGFSNPALTPDTPVATSFHSETQGSWKNIKFLGVALHR